MFGLFKKDDAQAAADLGFYVVENDDEKMELAIEFARSSFEIPLQLQRDGKLGDYYIKAALEDDEYVEHFWLIQCSHQGRFFSGIIDNDPQFVSGAFLGQEVAVRDSEISDWMFMANGLMWGNFTLRAAVMSLPPDERDQLLASLAPMDQFDLAVGLRTRQ